VIPLGLSQANFVTATPNPYKYWTVRLLFMPCGIGWARSCPQNPCCAKSCMSSISWDCGGMNSSKSVCIVRPYFTQSSHNLFWTTSPLPNIWRLERYQKFPHSHLLQISSPWPWHKSRIQLYHLAYPHTWGALPSETSTLFHIQICTFSSARPRGPCMTAHGMCKCNMF